MATLGVRDLKNRLSEFLRRVADGERVIVTDRGRPIAVIGPPASTSDEDDAMRMVREGVAKWVGGKPRGSDRPAKLRAKPISDTVLEDRHRR